MFKLDFSDKFSDFGLSIAKYFAVFADYARISKYVFGYLSPRFSMATAADVPESEDHHPSSIAHQQAFAQ